jgi:hypothetical protein
VTPDTHGPTKAFLVVLLGLGVLVGCTGARDASPVSPRLDEDRLGELTLTRNVPRQVRSACEEASRLATVRVVCPRLILDVPLTRLEGLWGSIVLDAEPRFYMLSFNNGGLPGGKRHWIVGSGTAGVVAKWVLTDHANEVQGNPELMEERDIEGHRILIYRFPPFPAGGPNGGHFGAFVRVEDEYFFASLHGRRFIDSAIAMALDLVRQTARFK